MNSKIKPRLVNKSNNFKEIKEQWIDSTKLRALGWTPCFSLKDGLMNCIEYYINTPDMK